MNQQALTPANRTMVRVVIVVLCVLALIAVGIVILAGHIFGTEAQRAWVGAGFLITALALAAGLLGP